MREVHSSSLRVDRVVLDVVLQLEVGLAGLAAEDVRGLARVELGLEDVEVLVGGDDLVVDVDAGLLLELLRPAPSPPA